MNKNYWREFFRTDLNLKNLWWHRLFKVLFFTALIISNISAIIWSVNQPSSMLPQWKVVEPVDSRLSNKLSVLGDLKKYHEKIDSDYIYEIPHASLNKDNVFNFDNVYGSLNMHENIETIISQNSRLGINAGFQINREDVSQDEFVKYIKLNKINCIILDFLLNGDEKVHFMRPANEIFKENIFFYEKDIWGTITYSIPYILLPIPFVLVLFSLIVLFYYKILMYIAYGSSNKSASVII